MITAGLIVSVVRRMLSCRTAWGGHTYMNDITRQFAAHMISALRACVYWLGRAGGSYYYAWERDGALSMRALLDVAPSFDSVATKFAHYVQWVLNVQSETDPHQVTPLTPRPSILEPHRHNNRSGVAGCQVLSLI